MRTLILTLLAAVLTTSALGQPGRKTAPLQPPAVLIFTAPADGIIKPFVAPDGTFSGDFAGVPTRKASTLSNGVQYVEYSLRRAGSTQSATILTAGSNVNADFFVDTMRSGMKAAANVTIASERKVKIGERDAVEFVIDSDLERNIVRVAVVGPRVFQFSISVTNWPMLRNDLEKPRLAFESEAARFFASAKILVEDPKPPPIEILGTPEEGGYRNDYLGFSITYGPEWGQFEPEEFERIKGQSLKIVGLAESPSKTALDLSVKTEALLFGLTKPSGAGRSSLLASVKTEATSYGVDEIVAATRRVLLTSDRYRLVGDARKIRVGPAELTTLDFDLQINQTTVHQRYYYVVRRGHAVVFVISVADRAQMPEFEALLKSIVFDPKVK